MEPTRGMRFARRYGYAAASAAYLFTLGVRSSRNRFLIRAIAGHFGFQEDYPRELPVVDVHDITRDSTESEIHDPLGEDGEVSLLELLVMARVIRERRPARLLEVGTFNGRTTLNMAANAPPDSRVITVDLPPSTQSSLDLEPAERMFVDKPSSGARFRDSPLRGKIEQVYGDSAVVDLAGYAADFVFIDGSHAYEYVLNDSRKALAGLPGGHGTILWHDYGVGWRGVTRALNELRRGEPAFGGLRTVGGTTLAILER